MPDPPLVSGTSSMLGRETKPFLDLWNWTCLGFPFWCFVAMAKDISISASFVCDVEGFKPRLIQWYLADGLPLALTAVWVQEKSTILIGL